MQDRIEGRNPVIEALRAGRRIDKLYLRNGEYDPTLAKIFKLAKKNGVVIKNVDVQALDSMSETGAHQGVIAFAAVHEYCTLEDILAKAREKNEPPFLVLCDRLTDPHNLGSIIRTANAAGVHGVVIPKHESVGLTATVAKCSAGALEYTPVARVTNLSQAIRFLQKEGVWVIGADGTAEKSMKETKFTGSIALCIGNEGEGLARLVRESCDELVRIPMKGQIESLNASVAAALLIYEVANTRDSSI